MRTFRGRRCRHQTAWFNRHRSRGGALSPDGHLVLSWLLRCALVIPDAALAAIRDGARLFTRAPGNRGAIHQGDGGPSPCGLSSLPDRCWRSVREDGTPALKRPGSPLCGVRDDKVTGSPLRGVRDDKASKPLSDVD